MKYVRMDQLKTGMILGKTLYTAMGDLLLRAGTTLQAEYIQRIKKMGYPGIYITDEETQDIELQEVVSDELKISSIQKLKQMFLPEIGNKKSEELVETMKNLQEEMFQIVDEVMSNKDIVINMVAIKTYDDSVYFHSLNVSVICAAIGMGLQWRTDEIKNLTMAAILHDIGKKFIPKEILNKKGPMTEAEYNIYKTHPKKGYDFLKEKYSIRFPSNVYTGVLQHHERFDGSGYPNGRKANEITKFAKVIMVADTYDAMITNRPNHLVVQPSDAYEFIMGCSGVYFDPAAVKAFSRCVAAYPVGVTVMLSNGKTAVIAENYKGYPTRPRVKLTDEEGARSYLDLKDDPDLRNITIKCLIV